MPKVQQKDRGGLKVGRLNFVSLVLKVDNLIQFFSEKLNMLFCI